jgi:NADPH-dependent 2,4-dienoyl-CoA reductase/sulfur reductase-like enzyme
MRIQRVGTARKIARTPKHPSGAFAHPTRKRKIGMSTARKIVVIGGGPAGVAALAAKQRTPRPRS